MIQLNNSPAFTGKIYAGHKLVSEPTSKQDADMIKSVCDELVKVGVKKTDEKQYDKDTVTQYSIGDSFQIQTREGPKTEPSGGGTYYYSNALKHLEFSYNDKNLAWDIDLNGVKDELISNFRDLLTSDNKREAIQGFMDALKGQVFPGDTF